MQKFLLIGASVLTVVTAFTAAIAQEAAKPYPTCTTPGQDSCQNPGEGGAPGHSRAADYAGGPPVYASGNEGISHRAPARHHRSRVHRHGSRHN